MTITTMRAEHVKAVAEMHVSELTGFLRALGYPAARAYYAGCVEAPAPRMIGRVAEEDGVVKGFVVGSMVPRALRLEGMLRRPLAFGLGAAFGMLRRPSAIPYVWDLLRGRGDFHDKGAPELTYLAVAPDQRRSGLGRQLVNAFSAAMRDAGATSYELSVDHENRSAEAFYEKLGFIKVRNYREFGVDRRRYKLELPK